VWFVHFISKALFLVRTVSITRRTIIGLGELEETTKWVWHTSS